MIVRLLAPRRATLRGLILSVLITALLGAPAVPGTLASRADTPPQAQGASTTSPGQPVGPRLSEARVRAQAQQAWGAAFQSFPPGYVPWPMLHHDRHRTGESAETGPDDPSVLGAPWPYDTGAPSASSPAIDADGTAYMGNEDGILHSVAPDGTKKWTFKAGGGLDSPAIGRKVEGPATIFAADTGGTVYALAPNGKLRWSLTPGGSPIRSSPVIADLGSSALYRLYVGDEDGTLWALFETSSSAATVAWNAALSGPIKTSPALSPALDVVYATAEDSLYCFDAMTGGAIGNSPLPVGSGAVLTTPVVDPSTGNVIVGTSGGDVIQVDGECLAPLWTAGLMDPVPQPPAVAPDGTLRVIAGDRVVALSSNGAFLWDQSLPDKLASAAPIVDSGGTTIVGSTTGSVFAVAANPLAAGDHLLWQVLVAKGGAAVGTPAIDFAGRIYVPDAEGVLNVIDDLPAFQIAYHSDRFQPSNLDVYSLRETYGVVDPARNLRVTRSPSAETQPAYSLDPHEMSWVSDELGNLDAFLATGNGGGGRAVSVPGPGLPFTPTSKETDPAFTPIDDRTGASRLPDHGKYLAMTTDASGVPQIVFMDLPSFRRGSPTVLSFTDWAAAQGVPAAITSQLEGPPHTSQSQIAFAPDGQNVAWVHCDIAQGRGTVRLLKLAGASSTMFEIGPAIPTEGTAGCRDHAPAFAPDSRWVIIQETATDLGIYNVVAPGPQAAVVIKAPTGLGLLHPNWAPDGSEIAAGRRRVGTTDVDLTLLSDKSYGARRDITATHTSDEPFYRFGKMPGPIAVKIRGGHPVNDTAQFPGQTIEILGRGFDILHPQENEVTFTDTLRGTPRRAQVLSARVDPVEGLGVLTVVVPDLAGNGPVHVTTRFGTSDCCNFTVLPSPTAVLQQHSVVGAKVRVFGLGFDLSPATNTVVRFSKEGGGLVDGTVLSGFIDGAQEVLVVKVPGGTAQAGHISAISVPGGLGKTCTTTPCQFSLLKPVLKVERLRNDTASQPPNVLPAYRTQGCPGCHVRVTAIDFPFDPFFGYGSSMQVRVATWNKNMPPQVGVSYPLVQTGPDTAGTPGGTPGGVASSLPSRPTGIDPKTGKSFDHEGDLSITAKDTALDPADPHVATAHFQVPLLNIPTVFVPGTSGNSLDLAASGTPLLYQFLGDAHLFPWICTACPLGWTVHNPKTYLDNPGPWDPRGPRIWVGPEMIASILANVPHYGGNHYLDVLEFDQNGNPVHPEIAPGPSPGSVFRNVTYPPGLAQLLGYEHGQPEYENLVHFLTGTKDDPQETVPNFTLFNSFGLPNRPLCSLTACTVNDPPQPSPEFDRGLYLFPYEFRGNMDDNARALDSFVTSILNLPRVRSLGITKVDIITHSLGGPTARAFYLQHPDKVNQNISFGGGFGGVAKPVKILMMGDNWMDGRFNGIGPYTYGIADWEVERLARNWGTAYYQAPNSEDWFVDDGAAIPGKPGMVKERAYVWDDRPPLFGGDDKRFHTLRESIDWIAKTYNGFLARKAQAFFGIQPVPLGEFRFGTGPIFHYRVIEEGVPTENAGRLYTGPSDLCVVAVALKSLPLIASECSPRVRRQPIMGDGDNTVPLHGALGMTATGDDRVFVIGQKEVVWPIGTTDHEMKHADMTSPIESLELVGQILTGRVCSQTQQLNFHSQNDIQVQEIFIDNARIAQVSPSPLSRSDAPDNARITRVSSSRLSRSDAPDPAAADRWLVRVRGATQVDVTDDQGRHDGPYYHPDYQGLLEVKIPNSEYDSEMRRDAVGSDLTTFFVSEGGSYSFRLTAVNDTAAELRLTAFNQEGVTGTVLFSRVPLPKNAVARFTYVTDSPTSEPVMEVTNPDGSTRRFTGVVLDPIAGSDTVAPTTTAGVDNEMVFVTASDEGGSGLSETLVSTGQGFKTYTGPFPLPEDAPFVWAFSTDGNGNIEYPGAFIALDPTAVDTTIASGPVAGSSTKSTTAIFQFTANEPVSRFSCSLDGADFTPCDTPQVYAGLADGTHTFQVAATDLAGNDDPTPASRSWTVDTTPPRDGHHLRPLLRP